MSNEQHEQAALRYVRTIGSYWAKKSSLLFRIRELSETMDGVGAFRYDGQPGAGSQDVSDRWVSTMEKLDTLKAELEERVRGGESDYQHALDVFSGNTYAAAVWLHYGERRTWCEVAKLYGYSVSRLKHMRSEGLEYIYDQMPTNYRL